MNDLRALGGFFSPDVEHSLAVLIDRFEHTGSINANLIVSLRAGLNRECFELCHRTLLAHFKLIEETVGFADYCDAISSPEGRERLYSTYPVLRRLMSELTSQWAERVTEILERLKADQVEIQRDLGVDASLDTLVELKYGLGDRHRGGRSVALLQFDGDQRLIYKPRSLSVDLHFASFLHAVSDHAGLDLRVVPTLSSENYGWCAFIPPLPCETQEEVSAYYERIGAFLAVLYVLNAFDFHYENLIAHGTHPVLVDLETFFHPHAPIIGTETNSGIDDSVLRTGLLPDEMTFQDGRVVDISGMANVAGREGVVERLTVKQDDAGRFVFERARGTLLGADNIPMLDGAASEADPYRVARLKQGFSSAYRAMSANKPAMRSLVEAFRGDEVRVIFRPTLTYSHMLDEARHPGLMLREDALTRYCTTLSKASVDYALGEVLLPYEVEDLRGRDVPMFSCRVGETDLLIDHERIERSFFVSDGMSLVQSKIARLNEEDLSRQLWIIDKSFAMSSEPRIRVEKHPPIQPKTEADHDLKSRLMAQATKIGDHICESVHEGETHASWLVMKSLDESNSRLAIWSAFYDLYGGMPGEIIYLSQLHRATGEARYDRVAIKAYAFLRERLALSRYAIRPLGLFGGWGSVIILSAIMARSTGNRQFLSDADEIFDTVDFETLISVDRNFGLVKGGAGFLAACAEHIRATGSRRAAQVAELTFNHLLSHSQRDDGQLSWRITSEQPLSGLSHGASGFAACFARMFEVTQDQRYRDACLKALAFERTLFLRKEGNWLDRRDHARKSAAYPTAMTWAHGAPGIGVARLSVIRSGICDDQILDELDIAVRATLAAGPSESLSGVSGDAGTIELLLGYAELIGQRYWPETHARLIGLVGELETRTSNEAGMRKIALGLMNGVTGAGYQCLRTAADISTPSIIGLQVVDAAGAGLRPRLSTAKNLDLSAMSNERYERDLIHSN